MQLQQRDGVWITKGWFSKLVGHRYLTILVNINEIEGEQDKIISYLKMLKQQLVKNAL